MASAAVFGALRIIRGEDGAGRAAAGTVDGMRPADLGGRAGLYTAPRPVASAAVFGALRIIRGEDGAGRAAAGTVDGMRPADLGGRAGHMLSM